MVVVVVVVWIFLLLPRNPNPGLQIRDSDSESESGSDASKVVEVHYYALLHPAAIPSSKLPSKSKGESNINNVMAYVLSLPHLCKDN